MEGGLWCWNAKSLSSREWRILVEGSIPKIGIGATTKMTMTKPITPKKGTKNNPLFFLVFLHQFYFPHTSRAAEIN